MSWTDKTPSPTQKAGANNAASPRDAAIAVLKEHLTATAEMLEHPTFKTHLSWLNIVNLPQDEYNTAIGTINEMVAKVAEIKKYEAQANTHHTGNTQTDLPSDKVLEACQKAIMGLQSMAPKSQQEIAERSEKSSQTTSPWAQGY